MPSVKQKNVFSNNFSSSKIIIDCFVLKQCVFLVAKSTSSTEKKDIEARLSIENSPVGKIIRGKQSKRVQISVCAVIIRATAL